MLTTKGHTHKHQYRPQAYHEMAHSTLDLYYWNATAQIAFSLRFVGFIHVGENVRTCNVLSKRSGVHAQYLSELVSRLH